MNQKIKKSFDYRGVTINIVLREETYLNSDIKMEVHRAIAPNDGVIPVSFQGKTLKGYVEQTIRALDSFMSLGASLEELTKKIS